MIIIIASSLLSAKDGNKIKNTHFKILTDSHFSPALFILSFELDSLPFAVSSFDKFVVGSFSIIITDSILPILFSSSSLRSA